MPWRMHFIDRWVWGHKHVPSYVLPYALLTWAMVEQVLLMGQLAAHSHC